MELMKPNFNFKVLSDAFGTPVNLQSLTLLYQPIIGTDAFSLYFLFLSLPVDTLQRHHLLLQIMDGSMDDLVKTRHRLEAVGLLDVYESDELVTYILKQPLSVKQFFDDAIMRAFLYVKIGARDFNALKNMLIIEKSSFIGDKSTKRFDEVFDVRALSRIQQNIQFDNEISKKDQGIEVSAVFEPTVLASILLKKGISQEIISSELLRVLNEFAFLYKFDVHELARLVFDALIPDGSVDFVRMKSLARTQFQLMNKGTPVQVIVKDEDAENEISKTKAPEQGIIAFLEQSPVDFLKFKSGGKPPVPADVKLVEWLYVDQGMPAGVVNVLVDYVLNYTDGNLPKQLVEKITGQWQRQGVNTTQAAMDKVMKSLTKSSDYQKEKQKPIASQVRNLKNATRVEPIPKWLGKVNNENIVDDVAAKERIEQMKREMLEGGVGNAENE